jgi:hypothetical protein
MKFDPVTGLQVLEKQPGASKLYSWVFTADLQGANISSVISITQTNLGRIAESTPVTVSGSIHDTDRAQAWIADGTSGEAYKMTAKVETTTGAILELDGLLLVRER